MYHEEEDEDDDDDDDVVMPLYKTMTVPRSVSNPDDRPITPLKDKMIYDLQNSSLDFKDGKPEQNWQLLIRIFIQISFYNI